MLLLIIFTALQLALHASAWMPQPRVFKSWGIDTLFPGPWEAYNKAPYYRTIRPVAIYGTQGTLVNPQGLVSGGATTFTAGSLITYEFKESVAGRYEHRRIFLQIFCTYIDTFLESTGLLVMIQTHLAQHSTISCLA